jgi:DNA-binding transcriptional LysR family regulator
VFLLCAAASGVVKVICDHSAYLMKRLQFHQQRPHYEGNLSLDSYLLDSMTSGPADAGVGDGTPVWYAPAIPLLRRLRQSCRG